MAFLHDCFLYCPIFGILGTNGLIRSYVWAKISTVIFLRKYCWRLRSVYRASHSQIWLHHWNLLPKSLRKPNWSLLQVWLDTGSWYGFTVTGRLTHGRMPLYWRAWCISRCVLIHIHEMRSVQAERWWINTASLADNVLCSNVQCSDKMTWVIRQLRLGVGHSKTALVHQWDCCRPSPAQSVSQSIPHPA